MGAFVISLVARPDSPRTHQFGRRRYFQQSTYGVVLMPALHDWPERVGDVRAVVVPRAGYEAVAPSMITGP